MKKIFTLLLCTFATLAQAGEAEIRQSIQSKFPQLEKIEHVVKTPYSGLYEVVIDGQLMYTDELGTYLIEGDVIDLASQTNLTEKRRQQLFAIDFDKLPLELAVKRVKGNGKRKMAYFSDPNCGFCKKLENELSKVSDVTLYIFYYPIFQGSDIMVHNILCAKDTIKTWDDWMQNGVMPPDVKCKSKISTEKVMALGKKLRVNGTPNLIFANGVQSPGYLPAEELEKNLNAALNK